jgi:hypothetical protein
MVVNVVLYLLWNKSNTTSLTDNNECPSGCNEVIEERISNNLPTPTTVLLSPTPSLQPTPTVTKKTTIKKITQYIPIPGNGTTLENNWVDLPGTEFYISTDDYPTLIGAYFEANMRLINGNGLAYVRLFDITSGIEVWGSEVSTSSQSFTSVSSGKITIRMGTHLYRIQAKSLTADTTIFNSGRIKMILGEN